MGKTTGLHLDLLEATAPDTESVYTTRAGKVQAEYERMKDLVQVSDPLKVELLEGLMWEAARARIQLQELNEIALSTGPLRVSSINPQKQEALPVVQELTKVRASYTHLMDRLMKHLDFSDSAEDTSFADFL